MHETRLTSVISDSGHTDVGRAAWCQACGLSSTPEPHLLEKNPSRDHYGCVMAQMLALEHITCVCSLKTRLGMEGQAYNPDTKAGWGTATNLPTVTRYQSANGGAGQGSVSAWAPSQKP